MKNPMEFFEHDRLLHIDMIDALRDKTTKVIYSEEDGVLFCRGGWLYEITLTFIAYRRKRRGNKKNCRTYGTQKRHCRSSVQIYS